MESGTDKANGAAAGGAKKEPASKAVKIIARALEDSDDDGWTNLGAVGKRILGAAPDFDPRTYGCSSLSMLVTKSGGFEVRKEPGKGVHIRRKTVKRKATSKSA